MPKKALIAAVHPWDSPSYVGSHAIAKQLTVAGWDVAFISAPITPFHWLRFRENLFKSRRRTHLRGGDLHLTGKLWHYVPYALIAPDNRPIFNSRWVFRNWHRLTRPNIVDTVIAKGFGNLDLLLLNSHYQPFWLDAIHYKHSLYRVADLNSGFPGCGTAALEVESEIVRRVDHVVTAAHTLIEPMRKMGARSVIPLLNGIDFDEFASKPDRPPQEYLGLSGPIAVYVGSFGPWFDFDLVIHCAGQLPDVNFVMIGSKERIPGHLYACPNLHFLGPRSRAQLPAYLHFAHVGLIPFDRTTCPQLVDHVNPLKLYEYLACGLPVITTDWAELRSFQHPATICKTNEIFIASIREILSAPRSPGALINYAKAADWKFKVANLLDILDMAPP